MTTYRYATVAEAQADFANRKRTEVDPAYGLFETVKADGREFDDGDLLVVPAEVRDGETLSTQVFIVNHDEVVNLLSFSPTTNDEHNYKRWAMSEVRSCNIARRKVEITRKVAAAVGERATVSESGYLQVDGRSVYGFHINEDMSSGSGRYSKPTDKLSVMVRAGYGRGSRVKRFPERKDGSHNYPEIARILIAERNAQVAREAAAARRNQNNDARVNLQKKLHEAKNYSWYVQETANLDKPVQVERKVIFQGTPEQAEALIAAIDAVVVQFAKE